ncbi:MAG: N-acetyltransferase family protein [Pyrinomonadaceae bacterium]
MAEIRKAEERDKNAVWQIIIEVLAAGDTYTDTDTSEKQMNAYWNAPENHHYVAEIDDKVVGALCIKANQPGRGSHVANASYMVASEARGTGVGKQLAVFSLDEARRLGFTAMQFNFVVTSNTVAVRLWESVGFEIIGEIPDAFDHVRDGLTNAYIMYRKL